MTGRALGVPKSLRGEHQVVVGLEILGIDGQRLLEHGDRLGVLAPQEEQPADLVVRDPVPGIRLLHRPQVGERLVVAAERLQRHRPEEEGAGERGGEPERRFERFEGPFGIPLPQADARDVHRSVCVLGSEPGHRGKGRFGGSEIALEQHPDAVVVEAKRPGEIARGGYGCGGGFGSHGEP